MERDDTDVGDVRVGIDRAEISDRQGWVVSYRGGRVCRSAQRWNTVRMETQRTNDERVGDGVEHGRIHVGVDGKVGFGIGARGDEDRVALRNRDGKRARRELISIGPINLGVIIL